MTKPLKDLKSPPHKIMEFLKKGRDDLREKYGKLRVTLRTAENQVRAVEKSRAMWRERAERAEAALQQQKKK